MLSSRGQTSGIAISRWWIVFVVYGREGVVISYAPAVIDFPTQNIPPE